MGHSGASGTYVLVRLWGLGYNYVKSEPLREHCGGLGMEWPHRRYKGGKLSAMRPIKRVSFCLNIAASSFMRLLSDCTEFIYLLRFPAEFTNSSIHYFLRPLQLPNQRSGKQPIILEIYCSSVTEEESIITVSPKSCAIRFQATPSPSDQIKVTAECHQYPVLGYFDYLLREIARVRPESREAIIPEIDEKTAAEVQVIVEQSSNRIQDPQGAEASSEGTQEPSTPDLNALDPLDRKIVEVVHKIWDEGRKATDEAVAMRLPLNPDTDEPYHRVTINKHRCALRDRHYKV